MDNKLLRDKSKSASFAYCIKYTYTRVKKWKPFLNSVRWQLLLLSIPSVLDILYNQAINDLIEHQSFWETILSNKFKFDVQVCINCCTSLLNFDFLT